MKTIIVFETAEELMEAARQPRKADDDSPCLPNNTIIVFQEFTDNIAVDLRCEASPPSNSLMHSWQNVVKAMGVKCGLKVVFE